MKKRGFLLISFICLFSIMFAMPYSTMGNINIPEAYILPHKMVDISFTNYFIGGGVIEGNVGSIKDNLYDVSGSVRFGLFDRAEVGFVYTSTAGAFGNLKVRIINETEKLPVISFGITNLFSSVSDFENEYAHDAEYTDRQDYISNSPFLVISKSLVIITGVPLMDYLETSFHFGMGTRRFLGKGIVVRDFGGVFAGMDIKPSRFWGFDLEWDSQNINLGLNGFYKNFTLRAGLYELEDFFNVKGDNSSKKYAINLKYTLDKFSDLKASEKRKKTTNVQQRAKQRVTPGGEEIYDEDSNPLRDELEQIRQRRKQAEKELEEIRKLLQE